jgi:hypothetical protein
MPNPLLSKLETRNSKLETRNSKLETRNSKLETRNSKLETRNSKLETISKMLLIPSPASGGGREGEKTPEAPPIPSPTLPAERGGSIF